MTVRRVKDAGWCAELHAGLAVALGGKTPPKSWIWHLESEAKNRKSDKSAPVAPCKCRSEHGAAKALVPARTRPSSDFTSAGVLLLFYCFVTNLLHRRQRKKGKGNVTVTPESQVPASLICIPPRRLRQAPPYGGGGFSFEHRARGSTEDPPKAQGPRPS